MEGDFGRYRLERLIGSGGMGDVYEAVDLERDRVVALKLLPELFAGSAMFEQRFRRESRVVARLRDPHIIPIHDFGEIDGRLYIDMRLVDGGASVASLLRDGGPMAPTRAVDLVAQVAEALDAAHTDGLIHRDVKPSNVLVTARDFVYVVDFGIAHSIGHTASGLTSSGSTVGTLDYMAPERFSNDPLDRRTDVYSLACLLYQCLSGRTPFAGQDLPALMYAHLYSEPPAPSALDPRVPAGLDRVVAIGMAKRPEDRYPTAGELGAAARDVLAEAEVGPRSGRATPAPAERGTPRRTLSLPGRSGQARPGGAGPARSGVAEPDRPAPVGPLASARPADPGDAPADTEPASADPASADPASAQPADPRPADPGPASANPVATDSSATVPAPSRGSPWRSDVGTARRPLLVATVAALAVVAVVLVLTRLDLTPSSTAPGPRASIAGAAGAPPASVPDPAVAGSVATPPTPGFLAVAPGGRFGYLANRDPRVVTVLDLARRATVATVPMPRAAPRFIAFSGDGGRAYVSSYDEGGAVNEVVVIDTRSNTVTGTVAVDKKPYGLAVSPDQRTLWVTSHDTGSIDLVDTATLTVTRRVPVAPNPHWVSFGRDRVYVANHESNVVSVLRADDASTVATVAVGRSPHSVALSPDGTRLAVTNYDADSVSLIDTATNAVVAEVAVDRKPQHVSYAADGRHLYTANVDGGTVSVVDTTTNRVTSTVPVGGSPTSVAQADPIRGTALVTCLDDARLTVLATARTGS